MIAIGEPSSAVLEILESGITEMHRSRAYLLEMLLVRDLLVYTNNSVDEAAAAPGITSLARLGRPISELVAASSTELNAILGPGLDAVQALEAHLATCPHKAVV
jgi:hypothetical protein